jgi:hypothetical protein
MNFGHLNGRPEKSSMIFFQSATASLEARKVVASSAGDDCFLLLFSITIIIVII